MQTIPPARSDAVQRKEGNIKKGITCHPCDEPWPLVSCLVRLGSRSLLVTEASALRLSRSFWFWYSTRRASLRRALDSNSCQSPSTCSNLKMRSESGSTRCVDWGYILNRWVRGWFLRYEVGMFEDNFGTRPL